MADLRMTKAEAASAVSANPGILLGNVERTLQPKITWLATKLRMDQSEVADMIRRRVVGWVPRGLVRRKAGVVFRGGRGKGHGKIISSPWIFIH